MIINNDVEVFSNAKIVDYQYIKSLNINRIFVDGSALNYEVELTLSALKDGRALDLKAHFIGVVDIQIGNISGMFCTLLEIEDISTWQLEGVSYQVFDSENDAFSFKCAEFNISF